MDYIIELLPAFVAGGFIGGLFMYLFKKKNKD